MDFFENNVMNIRGADNIKTLKVRIVPEVFPHLVGNTAGTKKKMSPQLKVSLECPRP